MRAMITNVLDYINFDLCCHLLDEGYEVIGIDTLNGNDSIKEEKLLQIGRNANFTLINDILERATEKVQSSKLDVVFHIAKNEDDSFHMAKEKSGREMKHLIKAAKKTNAKIIYVSSFEVYGNLYGEINEETKTKPLTPFGFKLFYDEKELQDNSEVPFVILRTAKVYGPWQHNETLKQVKKSKSHQVLYIDDAIKAMILAAKSDHSKEVFNITSRYKNSQVNYQICNEKAKEGLKFIQEVSLQKGKRLILNALKKSE